MVHWATLILYLHVQNMWMLRKLQAVVLQYSSLNDWIRLLLTSECCGLPRGECGNGFNYKQKLGSILSPRHEARILRSKSLPHHDIWKHRPHWKVIQVCMCGDLNMNTRVQLYSCIYLCVSYEQSMQISRKYFRNTCSAWRWLLTIDILSV